MPVCTFVQSGAVPQYCGNSFGRYAYALLRGQAPGLVGHWRNLLCPVLPMQQKPGCHSGVLCGSADPGGAGGDWVGGGRTSFVYYPIGWRGITYGNILIL